MKPYYWESAHGNFGDDLNLWLWDYLLPGLRDVHPDVLLVGVGTVLNRDLLAPGGRKLVVGSGFGYGEPPDLSDPQEWDIRCVRGPLTAERIGIDRELGVIDPAVMVADMPEFQGLAKAHDAIFLPHWKSTVGGIWPAVCAAAGLAYVDPRGEAKAVIRAIAQSRLVIAESMHAAILADAFRVPWVAVSTSAEINSFKWNDWAATLGVTYRPKPVPVSSRAEAITKGARFWGVSYEGRSFAPRPAETRPDGDAAVLVRSDEVGTGLRGMAKQLLAAPAARALRQARAAPPQLSADPVLEARKARLRAILDEIRDDYF